jgi:diguanylate cyclase (GGDEF)-like protein/PAS domain S-box-containing protein
MNQQPKLIVVEDIDTDAALLSWHLSKGGVPCELHRVETEPAFLQALRDIGADLILSDFSLPRFSGLRALELAVQHAPDIPFIFVSGTIGEERAINALRSGATDYVLKSNLSRLAATVKRALREASLKRTQRESEQQLRATVETSQDWIWETDVDGRFRFSSASVATILGFEPQSLIGCDFRALLAEPDHAASALLPAAAQNQLTGAVACWRTAGGELRWLERNVVAILDDAGLRIGYRGADRDITQRREQEERLRRLTRSYRMLSSTSSAILRLHNQGDLLHEVCRIAVDQGGFQRVTIALIDPGASSIRIRASAGADPANGVFPEYGVAAVLQSGTPVVVNDMNAQEQHYYGYPAMAVLPLLIDGTGVGVVTLLSNQRQIFDEAELAVLLEMTANLGFALQYQQKDAAVQFLSYFDSLTGLAKRPLFCERLTRFVANQPLKESHPLVIAFDVKKLGAINDTFGRYVGDRLLERIAARLRQHYEDPDCLAYLGGGTFAIMLAPAGHMDEATRQSQAAVAQFFAEPFLIDDQQLRLSVRSGLALYPHDAASADALVQNAEAALKAAQEDNEKHMLYSLVTRRPTTRSMALEARLAGALDRGEFLLHYQPKISLATGRIVGFEALLRWDDLQEGLVPPSVFIPLLEQSSAIVDVGEWVLQQASRDVRLWSATDLAAVRVAVNVSPLQLRRRDFVERVLRAIEPAIRQPAGIDIEITESMLMQDIELSIEKLGRLREAGVGIAIDDFGTGYSSLRLLARLPVDTLKIDRSFVQGMGDDASTLTLISTIVSLGRSFHMQTVAEGVETAGQFQMLRRIDCDQAQGYLFARPAPAAEVPAMIRRLSRPIALAEPGWDMDDDIANTGSDSHG